ncbi:uncharacterized protein TNCV_4719721 [Trichonephila clavipes]|uniref:Uncharacterized protein n=1 Tax=Trichonephila clavipes TaxID=2585209 RepID=A0A8X6W625_TRICX|nr:uncharacterized protein TNCV_4719721 [Trichonephila clavipes]
MSSDRKWGCGGGGKEDGEGGPHHHEGSHVHRTGEYFPPLQYTCRNCGGGDRGRVAIYRPFGEVSLSLNRTVTCMVLKANDRRTSCPCHDEFRGPRSDYVRQVLALACLIRLLVDVILTSNTRDNGDKPHHFVP